MRYLLIILFSLFSVSAWSQGPPITTTKANITRQLILPQDTLVIITADSGSLAFKGDTLYKARPRIGFTTCRWVPVGYVGIDNAKTIAGLISAGSNITITGAGTTASPYVINASGSGSGVSQATLNDSTLALRRICEWPSERPLGSLYQKNTWTNANDFSINGLAQLTANAGYLDLSGGDGTFGNNYVTLLTPTNLSKWRMSTNVKLTGSLASGTGMAFGLKFNNQFNQFDLTANFSFDNTGSSPIYIATSGGGVAVYQTSSGTIAFSQNDVINVTMDFNVNSLIVTATNITTGAAATTTTYSWANPFAAAGRIPNTCKFALYANKGTQQIQSVSISSTEIQFATLGMIGDSKTQLGFAASWAQIIGAALNSTYGSTKTRAGEGDGVNDVLNGVQEIKKLAPRSVILNIGSNSYRAGYTTSQIIGTYDSLTAAISASGTLVYHVVMPEDTVDNTVNAAGMTYLKKYIAAKYGSYYISNVWDTLADVNNRLKPAFDNGDGVHLTQAGVAATVTAIINSGKITKCASRIIDDSFIAATLVNGGGSAAGGNFINNQTTTQGSANFNISGEGKANSFTVSPSVGAGIQMVNISTTVPDAMSMFRPTAGTNQSMSHYLSPKGTGNGSSKTSIGLFNSDYGADPSNFGVGVFQMKGNEFLLYTTSVGTGTLVPFKLFTGSNEQIHLKIDGSNEITGATKFNTSIGIGTDAGSFKLKVSGAGVPLTLTSTTNTILTDPTGNRGVLFGYDTTAGSGIIAANTGDLRFISWSGLGWVDRMRLMANGSFNINNTTNLLYKLFVNGSVGINKDSLPLVSSGTKYQPVGIDSTTGQIVRLIGGGSGTTNLTYSQNATNNVVNSSTGTSATILPATASLAGLLDTALYRYLAGLKAGTVTSTVKLGYGLNAGVDTSIIVDTTLVTSILRSNKVRDSIAAIVAGKVPLILTANTTVNPGTSNSLYVVNDGTKAFLEMNGAYGQIGFTNGYIRFDGSLFRFIDGRATKVGIEYSADYSASYSTRSLTDKGYVDGMAYAPDASSSARGLLTANQYKRIFTRQTAVNPTGTITIDVNSGTQWGGTLTSAGGRTLAFSNLVAGDLVKIVFDNTSGGTVILTLPGSSFVQGTGSSTSVTLPTGKSILSLSDYDGSIYYFNLASY